jgi:hypothetical protein
MANFHQLATFGYLFQKINFPIGIILFKSFHVFNINYSNIDNINQNLQGLIVVISQDRAPVVIVNVTCFIGW